MEFPLVPPPAATRPAGVMAVLLPGPREPERLLERCRAVEDGRPAAAMKGAR